MFYFKNDQGISVIFANGTTASWSKDNELYSSIEQMCKENKWKLIEKLNNLPSAILNNKVFINGDTIKMEVDGDAIELNDTPITKFIKLLKRNGTVDKEIDRIIPFLKNMFNNPYIDAVTEIYDYCKAMDFLITDDGCFLAYKKVRSDLGSVHDNGKTKHVIGEYVTVKEFDTNRNNTCSKGLHFCSHNYLSGYSGDVILIIKVNPKDVVAIPTDYNFEKGRCCRYLPVGIIDSQSLLKGVDIAELTNQKVSVVDAKDEKRRVMVHGYISMDTDEDYDDEEGYSED